MRALRRSDPVELIVADALDYVGYAYDREVAHPDGRDRRIDFYVPALDLYIECKAMPTPRILNQLGEQTNIIVICGMRAAIGFSTLIKGPAVAFERIPL